ncbi:Uncharacterised protein [uncultured archaeon]|nr:Uncharacterised protein [uncultured archaeon]
MDDAIFKIIKNRLVRWEGQTLNQEKLGTLRDEIYQKTKTNKFAPFSNIKKWVKEARRRMAAEAKAAGKTAKKGAAGAKKAVRSVEHAVAEVPAAVQNSLDEIKAEMSLEPVRQEVSLPKPTVVMDKVYLQSISFEIAAMRSAMDRIGRQLDKLEKELNQHRQGAE